MRKLQIKLHKLSNFQIHKSKFNYKAHNKPIKWIEMKKIKNM